MLKDASFAGAGHGLGMQILTPDDGSQQRSAIISVSSQTPHSGVANSLEPAQVGSKVFP